MAKKDREWVGNKGEWSELYVFLKLLAQGAVQAIDEKLEKAENIYYPINKIMRKEQGEQIDYVINGTKVIIVGVQSGKIMTVDRNVIEEQAKCLLKEIQKKRKDNKDGKFELPEMEDFAKYIKVTAMKADPDEPNDIFMQIDDTHSCHDLGFSIKSFIGTLPTLVNFSQTTNFVYKVEVPERLSCEQIDKMKDEINKIKGDNKINKRMEKIKKEYGGKLSFDGKFRNNTDIFKRNLTMVDRDMPEIFADMLLHFYENRGSGNEGIGKCKKLLESMRKDNPLKYGDIALYEYKLKKFLCACALGMKPATLWNGLDEVKGGCIFVTKDGKILANRIYNRNSFEQYLLGNTKLAPPSIKKSKGNFMELYEEAGEMFINLNFQIKLMNLQLKGGSEESIGK